MGNPGTVVIGTTSSIYGIFALVAAIVLQAVPSIAVENKHLFATSPSLGQR